MVCSTQACSEIYVQNPYEHPLTICIHNAMSLRSRAFLLWLSLRLRCKVSLTPAASFTFPILPYNSDTPKLNLCRPLTEDRLIGIYTTQLGRRVIECSSVGPLNYVMVISLYYTSTACISQRTIKSTFQGLLSCVAVLKWIYAKTYNKIIISILTIT